MLVLKQDLEDRVNVQEKDPLQSIMDHSTLIIMLIMVLFTNFIQSTYRILFIAEVNSVNPDQLGSLTSVDLDLKPFSKYDIHLYLDST